MPFDQRYLELNSRCLEAIRYAEDTADELRAHCCERPKPQALLDPERLRQLRASRAATIAGLADPDPKVRLAALSLFGPEGFASQFMVDHYPDVAWVYGADAARPPWHSHSLTPPSEAARPRRFPRRAAELRVQDSRCPSVHANTP